MTKQYYSYPAPLKFNAVIIKIWMKISPMGGEMPIENVKNRSQ